MTDDDRIPLILAEMDRQQLSQSRLARRIGISQKHLNYVLAGKHGASTKVWDMIADGLGFRWEYRLKRKAG